MNGTDTLKNKERSADDRDAIKALLAENARQEAMFSLNPANSPYFTVSGMKTLTKSGKDFESADNGYFVIQGAQTLEVSVFMGSDSIELVDDEEFYVYLLECNEYGEPIDENGAVLNEEDDNSNYRIKLYSKSKETGSGVNKKTYYSKGGKEPKENTDGAYVFAIPMNKTIIYDPDVYDARDAQPQGVATQNIEIGKNYLIRVNGKDNEDNPVEPYETGYGFHLSSGGGAPVLSITEPSDHTAFYKKGEGIVFKGTAKSEEGVPEITVWDGDEKIATIPLETEIDGEVNEFNYTIPASVYTKEQLNKSKIYSLVVRATQGDGKAESSYSIWYDVDAPDIKINSIQPVITVDNKKCINGTLKINGTIIDSFDQVGSATYKVVQNGESGEETKLSGELENSFELDIDTTKLVDKKDAKIIIEASDRVGNLGLSNTKTETLSYYVDQSTDKPIIKSSSASLVITEGSDESILDDGKNLYMRGGTMILSVSDDDSVQSALVMLGKKKADGTFDVPTSNSSNTANPLYQMYSNPSVISHSLPNDLGVYLATVIVQDENYVSETSTPNNYSKIQFIIRVTGTGPDVTITPEKDYISTLSAAGTNTLKFEIVDEGNGPYTLLKDSEMQFNGATKESPFEYTITYPMGTTSADEIRFRVMDKNSSFTEKLYKPKFDNVLPEVSITSIPTKELTEDTSYLFRGEMSDTLSGVATIQLKFIDGTDETEWIEGILGSRTWNCQVEWASDGIKDVFTTDGEKTVIVQATDGAGNSKEISKKFVYDKIKPEVVSITETGKTTTPETINGTGDLGLTITIKDSNPIKPQVQIKQNGVAIEPSVNLAPTDPTAVSGATNTYTSTVTIPFSTAITTDGVYEIEVIAKDESGKSSTAKSIKITRDSSKPVVTNVKMINEFTGEEVYYSNGKYYINNTKDTYKISGIAADNIGVDSVNLEITKNGSTDKITKINSGTSSQWQFTGINLSTWTATGATANLEIKDTAGNVADQNVTLNIVFDTEAPTATHEIDDKLKDIIFRIGDYANDAGEADVGGKYSNNTYGSALTIQIRGLYEDTENGSGVNKYYYKVFNNLEAIIDSAKTNEQINDEKTQIYFKDLDSLAEHVIANKTDTFSPLAVTESRNVEYNITAGEDDRFGGSKIATKAGYDQYRLSNVKSNFKSTIKGFNEGKNYLVLVAEDNVGNTSVDYAEVPNPNDLEHPFIYPCYSLNVDITAPSIPQKNNGTVYSNAKETELLISGTVSDKPGAPNGSSGIKEIVFTNADYLDANGKAKSITVAASSASIVASPSAADTTLCNWTVDIISLIDPTKSSANISAKVVDNAGYETSALVANVSVDTEGPTIAIHSPAADTKTNTSITLKGSANDGNGAGINIDDEKGLTLYYTTTPTLGASAPTDETIGSWVVATTKPVLTAQNWTCTFDASSVATPGEDTNVYFVVGGEDTAGTGNKGYSAPVKVVVDRKAPSIESIEVEDISVEDITDNTWFRNKTLNVTGTATDTASGVTAIKYQIKHSTDAEFPETIANVATNGEFSMNLKDYNSEHNKYDLDFEDEEHIFKVWAVDEVGNESTPKDYTLKVDSTLPIIEAGNGAGSVPISNGETKTVTITVKDIAGSGIAYVRVDVGNENKYVYKDDFAEGVHEQEVVLNITSILGSGTQLISATVKDRAGNETTKNLGTLFYDGEAPSISIIDSTATNSTVTLSGSANDGAGSGIKKSKDLTFYYTTSSSVAATAPTTETIGDDPDEEWKQVSTAEIETENSKTLLPSITWEHTFDVTAITTADQNNTLYFSVSAEDGSGNIGYSDPESVLVDRVSPSMTFNVDSEPGTNLGASTNKWFKNTNLNITGTATDNTNGSGIKKIVYKVKKQGAENYADSVDVATDGEFDVNEKGFAAGTNKITVWAVDEAGNKSTENEYTIKIDKISPEITSDSITVYSNGVDACTISVAAQDETNGSGIASVVLTDGTNVTDPLTINAGVYSADVHEWFSSLASEKTVSISAIVTDVAGNEKKDTVAIITIDKTGPELTITTPSLDDTFSSDSVILAGTITDGAGKGVKSNTFKLYYTTSSSVAENPPTEQTISTTANSSWVLATTGTGSGVSGQNWTCTFDASSSSVASEEANTPIYFVVGATDDFTTGNQGYSSIRNIIIDKKAPVQEELKISEAAYDATNWFKVQTIGISGKFTDTNGSGVSKVWYQIKNDGSLNYNDAEYVLAVKGNDGYTFTANASGFQNGINNLKVWAEDNVGNKSTEKTYDVQIDEDAPEISEKNANDFDTEYMTNGVTPKQFEFNVKEVHSGISANNFIVKVGSGTKPLTLGSGELWTDTDETQLLALKAKDTLTTDEQTTKNALEAKSALNLVKIGTKTGDNYTVTVQIGTSAVSELNGNKPVTVTVQDVAGNKSSTTPVGSLNVDTTKPVVNISKPAVNAKLNKQYKISGSITEKNEIKSITLTATTGTGSSAKTNTYFYKKTPAQGENNTITLNEDKSWEITVNTNTAEWNNSTASEDWTLTVSVVDEAGNVSDDSTRSVKVDQNSDRPIIKVSQIDSTGSGFVTVKTLFGTIDDDDKTDNATVNKLWLWSKQGAGLDPSTAPSLSGSTWTVPEGWMEFGGNTKSTLDNNSWQLDSDEDDGDTTWFWAVADTNNNVFWTKADNQLNRPYIIYKGETDVSDNTNGISFKYDTKAPEITKIELMRLATNTYKTGTTRYSASEISGYITDYNTGKQEKDKLKWVTEDNYVFGADYALMYMKVSVKEETGMATYDASEQIYPLTISGIIEKAAGNTSKIEVGESSFSDSFDSATNVYTYLVGPIDFTTYPMDKASETYPKVNITITARDGAGKTSLKDKAVYVDNEANITVTKVSPDTAKETSGEFEFRVNLKDRESDVKNIQYYIPLSTENNKTSVSALASDKWNDVTELTLDGCVIEFTDFNSIMDYSIDTTTNQPKVKTGFENYEIKSNNEGQGIYNVPVWFKVTDEVGNIGYANQYVTKDASGNVSTPKDIVVKYNPNTDRPKVYITDPVISANPVEKGGKIKISGTAEDNEGIAAVYLQFDMGTGTFAEGSETVPTTTIKATKANNTKNWNCTLDVGSIANEKIVRVRAIAVDTDTSGQLVSAWSDVLSIKVNNTVPSFENMYLRQYDTDGTTVKVEKEYQLGMFVKGKWILEGTVSTVKSDNLQQLSIGDKGWLRSGNGTGNWGSSGAYAGATVSFVPDTSDKTIRFSIPVSGTSGEWAVGIDAYDNANNRNTETPTIYIDEKAPEFADYVGEKTDEVIKLYQDSYGGSGRELGDANFLKNSNGSKFTLAGKVKEPEGESGFEKAVFYFERFTGSGSSKSNPRVYNVMESRGQNNNANKTLVAASKAAINETHPIYINSDKLPVRPITVTRPSSGELSAEVIKTDKNIRNYGLVYVGGLYRTITSINRTTGVVTIDPADETNATEAEFVYGMVVDNNGEGENSDGTVRNDDGDGMLESWSGSQSAGYRWEATFNSANIPDGPIEIHVVVFDQAGNIGHGYMTTRASNNAPRITKVMLGTDLNGNGVFDYGSGEFNTFYAQKDDNQNPITKTGLANWNLITNEHLGNSKSWKVKNGIAVIPEFVGGAPDFYYQFSKAATSLDEPEQIASADLNSHKLLGSGANDKIKLSGTETKATWDYSTNKVDGVDVTNYGGSLTLTTEQINAATGSVTEDTEGYYRFTFWDSTEESTPGTDTGSTILNIQLVQDLTDNIAPTAEIEPFKWEGTGYTKQVSTSVNGGAATTTAAVLDTLEKGQDQYYVLGTETVTTSTKDENGNVSTTVTTITVTPKNSLYGASKANGHIELQEDIKNITAITSTLGADDPKVSGKITFHGTAFDETRLSSIWFKFDDFTPTNTLTGGDSSKTPATGYSQAAYYNKSSASWTLASATIADGWEISVTDKEFSQDGHTVDWYLSIDTSKISNVAGKDKAFTIVALDAAGKKSTIYASGSEDQTKVDDNGTLHKTPYYKVDVVPYITGISTELSEGNKKRPTVLSRSALGVYPVRRGSSISIEGFNLTGATTGVSIAGTAIDEEDRSATETGGVSVPVGAGISSGVVEVSVNSVSSLNNKTAKSITTGTGNTATTRNIEYNTEPNGQNNDKLTDKRELKILDVTTTTDITDKRMLDMAVYGTNLNFSAGYGPDNYGIIMKEGTNQRSVSKVRNSFTRYFDGALAINSEGTPFTISACGDSYTAVSAWGDGPSHLALTRGTTTASSYQEYQGANGTSLLYLESNWNGANFNNLDRFKLPDMVVTGNNADTKGYISYYDSTQKIIKFRYFVTNGTKVATNYTALTGGSAPGSAGDDYSIISKESTEGTVNNYKDSTSNQVYTQGYIAISGANANSQYSAVGVTGTTALVSWYDATNGALKMKYNPSPATSFSGYQVFSDYPSQGTITFDIKVDNGNTRSVEVPYTYVTGNNRTNTRNIHELAYQMNLVLSNGYGAYAEVDPRWNKLVVRSMQTGSSSSIEITNLNSTGNSNGSVYTGNTTFTANNTTFRGKLNGCGNAWQEVTIDDDSAGQYVVMKTDSKGGIHFAYYDTGNGDLKYAYMSSVTATPVVVTVDGYQQVGQYVDLALKETTDTTKTYVTPYISYYSMSNGDSKRAAKVAKLVNPITYTGTIANSASVTDGSVEELFTGAWEAMHVPTNGIPVQYRVNIGVTSSGNVYISYLADRTIEYVKVE